MKTTHHTVAIKKTIHDKLANTLISHAKLMDSAIQIDIVDADNDL